MIIFSAKIIPLHDDQSTASVFKHFGKYFIWAIIPNQTWWRIHKWKNSKENDVQQWKSFFWFIEIIINQGWGGNPLFNEAGYQCTYSSILFIQRCRLPSFSFFSGKPYSPNGHWPPFWNASVWWFPKPPSH